MIDALRWMACEQPERPPDDNTSWHLIGCRGCIVKADAVVRTMPETRLARLVLQFAETDWPPA
jgi:hypothetical protein